MNWLSKARNGTEKAGYSTGYPESNCREAFAFVIPCWYEMRKAGCNSKEAARLLRSGLLRPDWYFCVQLQANAGFLFPAFGRNLHPVDRFCLQTLAGFYGLAIIARSRQHQKALII
jgi:hypothetical protein